MTTADSLPTLRRKIRGSFFGVVLLYGVFGFILMVGVFVASRAAPKLFHVNYDSIAVGSQMNHALGMLTHPEEFSTQAAAESSEQSKAEFEKSLKFEEGNITEPGEAEIAKGLRQEWEKIKNKTGQETFAEQRKIHHLLNQLTAVNEKGMFRIIDENDRLTSRVLLGSILFFLVSLLLVGFLADSLAERLSRPIKRIAETLHDLPHFGRRLKLPTPTSLELLILTAGLSKLWERVSEVEKVNVQEVLREKNRLEAVLGSVEDALLVVDERGIITHCNACVMSLIALPENQIINKPWRDLSTNGENYLKLRAVLAVDMPNSQELELDLAGQKRQYSARSKIIKKSEQGAAATLFLLHDITEKRHREKFRAEFIDLLSHEIKTPLQSLGTACEILNSQKGELPADLQLMVESVAEDVDRIRAVANEFVQVTQSQSKIMKLKLQRIRLNQILPEWLKPFQVLAKDRAIKLRFEQEGSSVIWASLDPVKFSWVISNLVANAIRFSPENGVVLVMLTDRNNSVEVRVSDEGPGVAEEDQRKLFEPFFQSPMVGASGLRGLLGIGLTIAKEVVEAHEGRIEYFSRKPHGSEFRIMLPFLDLHHQ